MHANFLFAFISVNSRLINLVAASAALRCLFVIIHGLFQMCAQHPGHLFMRLHQAGDEVAGAGVVQIIGEPVDVFTQMNDQAFVAGKQFLESKNSSAKILLSARVASLRYSGLIPIAVSMIFCPKNF